MRNLEVNVQKVTILVPDNFAKWNTTQQIEFIQEKLNTLELTVVSYNLTKKAHADE